MSENTGLGQPQETPTETGGVGGPAPKHWLTEDTWAAFKDNKSLEKFKSPTDAINSYLELEKKMSTANVKEFPHEREKQYPFLKENFNITDDKYAFDKFEKIKSNEEAFGSITNAIKSSALTPHQAEDIMKVVDGLYKTKDEVATAERQKLSDSWAKYNTQFKTDAERKEHMINAKKAYDALVTDEADRKLFSERGIDQLPEITRLFNSIGKLMGEGQLNPVTGVADIQDNVADLNTKIREAQDKLMNPATPHGERTNAQKALDAYIKRKYDLMESLNKNKNVSAAGIY